MRNARKQVVPSAFGCCTGLFFLSLFWRGRSDLADLSALSRFEFIDAYLPPAILARSKPTLAKPTLVKPTLAKVEVLVVCKVFGFGELIVWVF